MTCSINKRFQLISLQPTPCKKDSNVSCVYCPNGVTNSLTCIRTNKKQPNSFSPSSSPLNKKGKEKEAHPYVQTRPKALFYRAFSALYGLVGDVPADNSCLFTKLVL